MLSNPLTSPVKPSYIHRTTEWFGLGGKLKPIQFQTPAMGSYFCLLVRNTRRRDFYHLAKAKGWHHFRQDQDLLGTSSFLEFNPDDSSVLRSLRQPLESLTLKSCILIILFSYISAPAVSGWTPLLGCRRDGSASSELERRSDWGCGERTTPGQESGGGVVRLSHCSPSQGGFIPNRLHRQPSTASPPFVPKPCAVPTWSHPLCL